MCEASGGAAGICVWMNSVCTNSGGTAPRVGHPGVGVNLISSLPCTSAGAVPVVTGGDIWVVGNGDVVGDVGGQVSSLLMDGDRDVSLWVCDANQMWARVSDANQMWARESDANQVSDTDQMWARVSNAD
nr:hypothetical protein CFP56_08691 [Quercus suber]